MRRTSVGFVLGCLIWLGLLSTPAQAGSLLLSIDVSGSQACAADNNTGCGYGLNLTDLNPAQGIIELGTVNIGGLEVLGSTQIQEIATGVGDFNVLNTSSLQVTNTTGGTLTGSFAVSATDFQGPASVAFASGSANWQQAVGSSLLMQWYNDPANGQGAETPTDLPGSLLPLVCSDLISLPADSTACSGGPYTVNDEGLFSMTLFTQYSLVAGGVVVNRGQTELKPQGVPEPVTLTMLGLGLVGAARRFKHRVV